MKTLTAGKVCKDLRYANCHFQLAPEENPGGELFFKYPFKIEYATECLFVNTVTYKERHLVENRKLVIVTTLQ